MKPWNSVQTRSIEARWGSAGSGLAAALPASGKAGSGGVEDGRCGAGTVNDGFLKAKGSVRSK
jgi:hypothetical protein